MSRAMRTAIVIAMLGILTHGTEIQANIVIDWVTVGDPGNVVDTHGSGYGGVADVYNIGKYEVTNSQYEGFLNAVAASDPHGLYSVEMGGGWNDIGGIARNGSPGGYAYSVRPNRGNRPVNFVDWYDTLRFANWMHNGQPTGSQNTSTTEDGAYDMSLGDGVVRKPGALFFLPTEDEWYKAAYYKGGGTNAGYWYCATQSDTLPVSEAPPGRAEPPGSANYWDGGYADPNYLTDVGAYILSPGPYGTFDQNGNIYEWNEATIGASRGLRGGSWFTNWTAVPASARGDGGPLSEASHVGFRLAEVPEPATLSLLLVGGIVAMGRRRQA